MRLLLGCGICLLMLVLLDAIGMSPGRVALCMCVFNLLDRKQRYRRNYV